MDFDTLAARALNSSRAIHKPTYAGLRILIAVLQKNKATFNSFLCRRSLSRMSWRYISFEIVKEASKAKAPVYRNCITGSPLTTLAEAHVLGLMAGQPAFAVPSCAYSYLWPTERMAGRNFEYFLEGYERRNRRVAELLSTSPDHVAVIADIRSFYPSVNRQRLRETIACRVAQIQDQAVCRPIRQFTEAFLALPVPKAGIPVGPDLSHALGHLALESVDRAMMHEYGERYLRYVDDIISGVKKALVTVDPTPFFAKYGNNAWAAVKAYQAAQVDYAAAPVIKKYTGVLAAADVYTASTTFIILESIRLDLGVDSQVHP